MVEDDKDFHINLHGKEFKAKGSIQIFYGKYHLKNWEYFIELSCAYPELIIEFVIDATRTELIISEKEFREILQINSFWLIKPKTRPGVSRILSTLIQDPVKIKDIGPEKIDKILENLDNLLEDFKNRWAYGHSVHTTSLPSDIEKRYHLKNWEILIDYITINRDAALEIIGFSALLYKGDLDPTEENLKILEGLESNLDPKLNAISCSRTREGVETILLMLIENSFDIDLDPDHFDEILKLIDYRLDEILKSRTRIFF